MSNMKRLLESIQESARLLAEDQPLSDDGLTSLFDSLHQVALHGNVGVRLLASELFPPSHEQKPT